VDIRRGSPTFGRWVGELLSSENRRQLYIPEGFAHGFCVLSDTALFCYKCTDSYLPQFERSLRWNDPDLAIDWPVASPLLSKRDGQARRLSDFAMEELPTYEEVRWSAEPGLAPATDARRSAA
jgi:dTDP-4-dehydrorhamnose 3,5-epimerase